jgi:hypothetical protein
MRTGDSGHGQPHQDTCATVHGRRHSERSAKLLGALAHRIQTHPGALIEWDALPVIANFQGKRLAHRQGDGAATGVGMAQHIGRRLLGDTEARHLNRR